MIMKKGLAWCALLLPICSFGALSLIQKSDPAGLFSQSTHYFDYNDTFLTRAVPEKTGGYAFTHWEINGNRTSVPNISVALQVTGQITENTQAVAKYSNINADSDQDGIKDWYEIRTKGSISPAISLDDDNDTIPFYKEYKFGLNPNSKNTIHEGGISIRRASKVFVNLGGARKLQVRSDPAGLVTSSSGFPEVNSTYHSQNLNGLQNGYYFSHWEVNGIRKSDSSGKGLSKISEIMDQDKEIVARFIKQDIDSDKDNIPDWYEWHEFGTLNFNNQSNPDEDLFTLQDERRFGLNGNIEDRIQEGGISIRRSGLTRMNLGGGSFVKITSDPPGMVNSAYLLQEKNSTYQSPTLNGKNGKFVFSHWEINGIRQESPSGIALSRVIEKLDTDKTIIAKYFEESIDSDEDGIQDWYENQQFGNLENSANSDPDGDGFLNFDEIKFGLSPVISDQISDGGIAMRRTKMVSYVKDLSDSSSSFDTDGDGLSDKEEAVLGSNATLADTDGDGYSDNDEFLAGSNLLDAKSFPNQPPNGIYLTNDKVKENESTGSLVGKFAVSDPNPNSIHKVILLGKNNNELHSPFFIDENNSLRTNIVFDYEKNQSVEILVKAIDSGNLSFQKKFVINITNLIEDLDEDGIEDAFDSDIDGDGFSNDQEVAFGSDPLDPDSLVNRAPYDLLLTNAYFAENLPTGTILGKFIVLDKDLNSSLSYSLTKENDLLNNQDFIIDENGTLRTNRVFDYESDSNISIHVRVKDEFDASLEKKFFLFVTDVFEEPINRLPLVITEGAMELEKNQTQFKGSILEQGDFETEEVGFIFHLNNKTVAYKAVLEPKKNSFTLVSSGLESGINHYFQAYAKTSFGVAYGSIRKFLIIDSSKTNVWWSEFSNTSVDGWLINSWMGSMMPLDNKWAYHQHLKWIYLHKDGIEGFWIWKEETGWVWTTKEIWPFLWSQDSADWLYLMPTESGYLFYDYSTRSLK